jgi:mannose-6-phosphate isomerase-like protein (cupin superfamily)
MSDYTLKNLSEIDDAAAGRGLGDISESRFPRGAVEAEQTGLAHHSLKPGKRQAFGHSHDEAEEVNFVVRGSGRVKLDDELVELSERDVLRISPKVKRRFEAGPDGLEWIVFGPHHEKDGALHEDFWAE